MRYSEKKRLLLVTFECPISVVCEKKLCRNGKGGRRFYRHFLVRWEFHNNKITPFFLGADHKMGHLNVTSNTVI